MTCMSSVLDVGLALLGILMEAKMLRITSDPDIHSIFVCGSHVMGVRLPCTGRSNLCLLSLVITSRHGVLVR